MLLDASRIAVHARNMPTATSLVVRGQVPLALAVVCVLAAHYVGAIVLPADVIALLAAIAGAVGVPRASEIAGDLSKRVAPS